MGPNLSAFEWIRFVGPKGLDLWVQTPTTVPFSHFFPHSSSKQISVEEFHIYALCRTVRGQETQMENPW